MACFSVSGCHRGARSYRYCGTSWAEGKWIIAPYSEIYNQSKWIFVLFLKNGIISGNKKILNQIIICSSA